MIILVFQLEIEGAASTFLYFGYTSIMVFCFFLLTGIYHSPPPLAAA
jgi:hypothetical protein